MAADIDETAQVVASSIGDAEIREFVTVHDSTIGDDCRIYERTSLKKTTVADGVDVNANSYVEAADVESGVQIGPNCSVVGVTHDLDEDGMTFREDRFERITLGQGAFVGAGAVISPGVEVGAGAVISAGATVTRTVPPQTVVLGSPPEQERHALSDWLDYQGELN